jgi:hypothetical protein
MKEYSEWRQYALDHQCPYLCIMKDLEDQEEYPVYCKTFNDLQRHQENLISESKAKLICVIEVYPK